MSGDPKDLINALPIPAVVIETNRRIAIMNGPAETIFGSGRTGLHFSSVFRQPAVMRAVDAAFSIPAPQDARLIIPGRTGETEFAMTASQFGDGAVLLGFVDETHRLAAGQVHQDFVANVSHELRTPLTALAGIIETLRGPARGDDAALDHFLSIMARETARMNRLVGDLLHLSRVEAGSRIRPRDPVDLAAIVEQVRAQLAEMAAQKGTSITVEVAAKDCWLAGAEDQLTTVVTNLCENALKYGDGKNPVLVTLEDIDHDVALRGPALKLTVSDSGPGIAKHHIPRLTERFYRVDDHRSRDLGGTGLGLAIVKHVVTRHGGRMKVESQTGQGSRFHIILPRTAGLLRQDLSQTNFRLVT